MTARGRPRGDLREAIRGLISQPMSCHLVAELAHQSALINAASRAEVRLVRKTLDNMARAGELHRVPRAQVAGAPRPVTLYAPAPAWQAVPGGDVWRVMQGWGR